MTGVTTVTVPDIGDFKHVPVIEILVKAGDRVSKDSPLVVLESEKATLDVPAPQDGTIRELKISVGDRVSVGAVILTLEGGTDEAAMWAKPLTHAPPVAAVLGDTSPSLRPPMQSVQDASLAQSRRSPHASPSIRRIAREFGVDLDAVHGSGPRGRIMREDVQSFVKAKLSTPKADVVTGGFGLGGFTLAPWPQVDFAKFGPIERVAQSKIRKISATNLTRNAVVIPHVTNFEDADITDLEAFRRKLNAENRPADLKVTILPFLIKAAGATLARFRQFNSSLDGDELVLKGYAHIGFAADTPNGLVVPVIRDVDKKGIHQIAAEAAALAAQARDGKLKPADMQGGCFTVSSLGGVGGTGFTPLINAPEVAILGVTRAQMRPVWDGTEFQPRLILPLMLSWDHRVVDGVAAARFLVHLSTLLEDFRRVML
jgi:pyruvate dehydrogenase E2 component (dihydrolipoamide acetyltransferase)